MYSPVKRVYPFKEYQISLGCEILYLFRLVHGHDELEQIGKRQADLKILCG